MNVFKKSVNSKLVEFTIDGIPQSLSDPRLKLGDKIAKVAMPIARALRLPCIDDQGQLRPESNCAQRRDALNNFADSIYDIFWPPKTETSKQEPP